MSDAGAPFIRNDSRSPRDAGVVQALIRERRGDVAGDAVGHLEDLLAIAERAARRERLDGRRKVVELPLLARAVELESATNTSSARRAPIEGRSADFVFIWGSF